MQERAWSKFKINYSTSLNNQLISITQNLNETSVRYGIETLNAINLIKKNKMQNKVVDMTKTIVIVTMETYWAAPFYK